MKSNLRLQFTKSNQPCICLKRINCNDYMRRSRNQIIICISILKRDSSNSYLKSVTSNSLRSNRHPLKWLAVLNSWGIPSHKYFNRIQRRWSRLDRRIRKVLWKLFCGLKWRYFCLTSKRPTLCEDLKFNENTIEFFS